MKTIATDRTRTVSFVSQRADIPRAVSQRVGKTYLLLREVASTTLVVVNYDRSFSHHD